MEQMNVEARRQVCRFDDWFIDKLDDMLHGLDDQSYQIVERKPTMLSDTVWFACDDSPAELRLAMCNGIITISRVQLEHQRSGIFTELMKVIMAYAQGKGVIKVVIQSVETKAMAGWCRKNGYMPVQTTAMEYDGYVIGDYSKAVYYSER